MSNNDILGFIFLDDEHGAGDDDLQINPLSMESGDYASEIPAMELEIMPTIYRPDGDYSDYIFCPEGSDVCIALMQEIPVNDLESIAHE